jgi:hypothetical protein
MQDIARKNAQFSKEEMLPYKGAWKVFLRWWTPIAVMPQTRTGVMIVGGKNAKDLRSGQR